VCGTARDTRIVVARYAADGTQAEVMSNFDLLNGFDTGYVNACAVDPLGNTYVTMVGAMQTGSVSVLAKLNGQY